MKMKVLFFLILFFFIFPSQALAYLDPGTGSYFIQLIIGGFLGGLYLTKSFWSNLLKKLIASLKSPFKAKSNEEKNY